MKDFTKKDTTIVDRPCLNESSNFNTSSYTSGEWQYFKEIIEEILSIGDDIRFVGVIHHKENAFCSKMQKGKISLLTPQEERFAIEL